jgi:hypothetical protein
VEHIVVELARIYEGTKNENDWMFYHDAFLLMMVKEMVRWMKEKDYLKHWILPMGDPPMGRRPENLLWTADWKLAGEYATRYEFKQ